MSSPNPWRPQRAGDIFDEDFGEFGDIRKIFKACIKLDLLGIKPFRSDREESLSTLYHTKLRRSCRL